MREDAWDRDKRGLSTEASARCDLYDQAIASHKRAERQIAFLEGCLTGLPGFACIPFNIALATLLGFRATQSVATFYGYGIKNGPAERALAGEDSIHSMERVASPMTQ